MYFQYGQEETEYLSGKDEKLGAVIAQVGRVNREVDTDLFSAVVHHIVGQQISTKAQATIWQRMPWHGECRAYSGSRERAITAAWH